MRSKLLSIGVCLLLMACTNEINDIAKVEDVSKGEENVTNEEVRAKERVDISLTAEEKTAVDAQTDFAFRFFKEANAIEGSSSRNIIVSPLSAELLISMMANGVAGDANSELLQKCFPGCSDITVLNSVNKKLVSSLTEVDNTVTICIANSMWQDNSFSLLPEFEKIVSEHYYAESYREDMYSVATGDKINEWVSSNTNGIITETVKHESTPNCDMMLVNTIYYKGKWSSPFDPDFTSKEDFFQEDGGKVPVDMMCQKIETDYMKTEDLSVARIPYGNSAFSFYVLIPEGKSDAFISEFDSDRWIKIKENLMHGDVLVKLPRFEASFKKLDIIKIMKRMGVERLFSDKRSLAKLSEAILSADNLFISHSSVLKVEETGSEGAAETHLGIVTASPEMEIQKPVEIRADRPFVYLIEEQSTGAVIFIGKKR